jgi:predicted nuclease of predicted toxin-antitoxin system
MARFSVIRFLLDNNVPDSVARYLRERGHDVELVRDVMAADAKDPVVAVAAIKSNRVLVSWDRDFDHQRFQQPVSRP